MAAFSFRSAYLQLGEPYFIRIQLVNWWDKPARSAPHRSILEADQHRKWNFDFSRIACVESNQTGNSGAGFVFLLFRDRFRPQNEKPLDAPLGLKPFSQGGVCGRAQALRQPKPVCRTNRRPFRPPIFGSQFGIATRQLYAPATAAIDFGASVVGFAGSGCLA